MEYNLQDLKVCAAMYNIHNGILPLMEKVKKEHPAAWKALGIRIFDQASARILKATTVKPLASISFDILID